MPIKRRKNNSGFTLVEMMVSVSIFVIVAFIVTTTMLTLTAAYKKAQKLRILMDNLNFSIQDMSLTFREGKQYGCTTSQSFCDLLPAYGSDKICFKKLPHKNNPTIESIIRCDYDCSSCILASDGVDIISPEIEITNLNFVALPASGRKRVVINIRGVAGKNTKYETDFNIQTTAAQRNP